MLGPDPKDVARQCRELADEHDEVAREQAAPKNL
jgi:hypothetical protein